MVAVLSLIRLVFVTLNVLMGVLFVMTSTESCGSVFEFRVGYALVGHVMVTSNVSDEFECQQKCIENKMCKSFNIHHGADNTKRICELNNKTRKMKPDDFKKKKGSTYHGSVKVSCVDVPHGKHKQTSSGHCHPGYKGKRCENLKRGWYSHHPAYSCKDIRDSGDSKGNGKYWIDPENSGKPLKVYCDMTTNGGGWLLVSNIVMRNTTPPFQIPVQQTYHGISSDQMVLTKTAMNELRMHLSFTQLRFHCSKTQGRTFHVITAANNSGLAVVQYFSGQTDVQPASCGSFVRMEDDNSQLAKVCEKWGKENDTYTVGKWGHDRGEDRLKIYPAFTVGNYHWLTTSSDLLCDDVNDEIVLSIGDFWKVYVR